jgi:hypothetical protein
MLAGWYHHDVKELYLSEMGVNQEFGCCGTLE